MTDNKTPIAPGSEGRDSNGTRGKKAKPSGVEADGGSAETSEDSHKTDSERVREPKSKSQHGEATVERPKRPRRTETYDEVKRRKVRKASGQCGGYMESGRKRTRKGVLKNSIQISAVTVTRIVKGKYEWRDGDLKERWRGRRRRDPG